MRPTEPSADRLVAAVPHASAADRTMLKAGGLPVSLENARTAPAQRSVGRWRDSSLAGPRTSAVPTPVFIQALAATVIFALLCL
jgi:hypothetical protein